MAAPLKNTLKLIKNNLTFSSPCPKKRWYPINPEIPGNTQEYPESPRNTCEQKKYPKKKLDRIFQHSYPTWTRPANRYFFNTRPGWNQYWNPYLLGTAVLTGISDHIRILGYHPGAPPAPKTTAHQVWERLHIKILDTSASRQGRWYPAAADVHFKSPGPLSPYFRYHSNSVGFSSSSTPWSPKMVFQTVCKNSFSRVV